MSTKVLLPKKNSVWGVIVKPQAGNVYRNVLSFDNQDVKDQFINKYLFEAGDDYKVLIKQKKEVSIVEKDSMNIEFVIAREDYPNETFQTLLQKDFAIFAETINSVTSYRFYAITQAVRRGQGIAFTAEVDVFFTWDIKDMFEDKLVPVKYAHMDRLIKSGEKYLINQDIESSMYNLENFDVEHDNFVIKNNLQFIYHNVNSFGNFTITPSGSVDPVYLFSQLRWNFFAKALPSNLSEDRSSINGSVLPYVIGAYCTKPKHVRSGFDSTQYTLTGSITIGSKTIDLFPTRSSIGKLWDDATTLKNFNQKTIFNPMSLTTTKYSISLTTTATNIDIKIIDNGNTRDDQVYIAEYGTSTENYGIFQTNYFEKGQMFDDGYTNMLDIKPFKEFESINDYSHLKNIDYESKLQFHPYRKFILKTSSKNIWELRPQLFNKDQVSVLYMIYGFTQDNHTHIYRLTNYNELTNRINTVSSNMINTYEDVTNYKLPTEVNAWSEFISQNTAQQNSQFMNKTASAIVGAGSILASGGIGGLLGIGAASLAANSVLGISQQLAQRQDIKNTPNQILNTGSSILSDEMSNSMIPKILELEIIPTAKKMIYDHFYTYGYNHNNSLYKINDLLKTRYYFNYIECDGTFEIIKIQCSSSIKQLIEDTLSQGVTIWNVRDIKTFKGVKNYDYENIEMSLLTTPSPAPKISRKKRNATN